MAIFNTAIAASSDDAAEYAGTVTLNGTGIGFYYSDYYGGFRFTSVTIPQGATIDSATLTLTVASTSNDNPNLSIAGQAIDNAPTFATSSNNITTRTKTTASVSWNGTDIGTGAKDSPDIKSVIQEIINRPGWASGNSLALLVRGTTTSNFTVRAYDFGSAFPALTIDYTAAAIGAAPRLATVRLTTKIGGTLTS